MVSKKVPTIQKQNHSPTEPLWTICYPNMYGIWAPLYYCSTFFERLKLSDSFFSATLSPDLCVPHTRSAMVPDRQKEGDHCPHVMWTNTVPTNLETNTCRLVSLSRIRNRSPGHFPIIVLNQGKTTPLQLSVSAVCFALSIHLASEYRTSPVCCMLL